MRLFPDYHCLSVRINTFIVVIIIIIIIIIMKVTYLCDHFPVGRREFMVLKIHVSLCPSPDSGCKILFNPLSKRRTGLEYIVKLPYRESNPQTVVRIRSLKCVNIFSLQVNTFSSCFWEN
jgi:hypothetical protein